MEARGMTHVRRHAGILIAAVFLIVGIYFIFNSGPIMTCAWGLAMAGTLFWMRETYRTIYGLSESLAGLFILYVSYTKGRGGFSSGFFAEAVETFQCNVVLISTLGAVYVMVRGFDNIKRAMRA
jgi:hypothetical protein